MARKHGSFRTRASSLLHSSLGTIHQGLPHDSFAEKRYSNASGTEDAGYDALEQTRTGSTGSHSVRNDNEDVRTLNRQAQRVVRTLPTWVHSSQGPLEDLRDGPQPPDEPNDAHVAQHNFIPAAQRRWDEDARTSWTSPWPGAHPADTHSRWRAFVKATEYSQPDAGESILVSEDWLREHGPDYNVPWLANPESAVLGEATTSKLMAGARHKTWYFRFQRKLFRSPVVPLIVRLIVLGFSAIALGLASSIHHITDIPGNVLGQTPSTNMAIIVDAVAIVYLMYITYDEYSGKPLGLRATRAKLRLIFLDLFFIVFDSANLSIAFVSIRNVECDDDKPQGVRCNPQELQLFREVLMRQKALASVLLVALIAWLLTFAISIARLVEKITH